MAERYEIKGKIARGGIGAIYRAYDTVMGRDVAIKRLLPIEQTHLNEAADESLKREAAALARFQHPNVVSIFAFEEDVDGPYVVMEMVEGETLKELIDQAALPVDDFIELTIQVLDPLIAAKELNLLHRDIKPSNIMLTWLATGRFQIKVLDFGLSKFSHAPSTQTLDQTGSFLGSIDYLAPEQLDLQKLDQRTDLYSLGCVLYFCLTQQPPFDGGNAAQTMRNHLTHKVTHLSELRPDLPGTIANWVMRMISRYPNQRPDDAKAALVEFLAARDGNSPGGKDGEEETIPVAILLKDEPVDKAVGKKAPAQPKSEGTKTQFLTGIPEKRTQPQLIVPQGDRETEPRRKIETALPNRGRASSPSIPPKKSAPGGGRGKPSDLSEPEGSKKGIIAVALILTAALIIGLLAFAGKDDNETEDSEKGKSSAQSTPKRPKGNSQGTPPPPMPTMRNPSPRPKGAVAPAITEGLVAHYSASAAGSVFGPDFRSPAKVGERVSWWSNLHKGATSDHLLSVEARHQNRGPKLVMVGPAEHPELAGSIPVLEFENSTTLASRGQKQIARLLSGTSMTSVVVMRPDVDRAGFLRFNRVEGGSLINWEISPAGHKLTMSKGSLNPSIEAKVGDLRDGFLVLTHVWNGEKVEQLLYLTLPGGRHVLAVAGDAPFKPDSVQRYSLGGIATGNRGGTFAGQLAEWIIYDRVLTNEERESVAGKLAAKYLAPDHKLKVDFVSPMTNGEKPAPHNAETNAATVAPKLPVTQDLVAHYSASDFTFGNDLRHSAKPGQRVMAWANLAPETNADHLLAYQNGKEAATPVLMEVTSAEFPELNGAHRVLHFSEGDTLESRGGGQVQSKMDDREFTCVMVMQSDLEKVLALRLKSPSVSPAAAISHQPGGFSGTIRQGKEWKKTAPAAAPAGKFAIVSLTWQAEKGTHLLHVKLPDGKSVASKPMKSSAKSLNIDGYRLGKAIEEAREKPTQEFEGRVAELIIYGKALSDRDREEIEEHLYQRYFAK